MLKNLLTLRVERGMTQEELAERVGGSLTQEVISLYEAGKRVPLADRTARIADVLGCTVDELIGREQG